MSITRNHQTNIYRSCTKDAGSRTAVNGKISWTNRFIMIAIGKPLTNGWTSGHMDFNPLPANYDVPILDSNGAARGTRATDASGALQLNSWESLCYQITPPESQASNNAHYFITAPYNTRFHHNESTIVVCHRGNDKLRWMDDVYTDLNGNTVGTPSDRDFWRTASSGLLGLPSGVQADESGDIIKRGKVGIGQLNQAPTWAPVAQLDVSAASRTGNGNLGTVPAFRVTGNLPGGGSGVNCNFPTGNNIATFLHSNQTQGIGFQYDGIYAAGSNSSQDLGITMKGSGSMYRKWPAATNPMDYRIDCAPAVVNMAYYDRDYMHGLEVARVLRGYHETATGSKTRNQWYQQNNGLRTAMRLQPTKATNNSFSLSIAENEFNRDKVILYQPSGSSEFHSMSIGNENNDSGAVTVQTYSGWATRFYNQGTTYTKAGARLQMEIQANGNVSIGSNDKGTRFNGAQARLDVRSNIVVGGVTSQANRAPAILGTGLTVFAANRGTGTAATANQPVFRMVEEQTGGVRWGATAEFRIGHYESTTNARSELELWMGLNSSWTPNVKVLSARANGQINLANVREFNGALLQSPEQQAIAAGLVSGDLYHSGGLLRIVQ